LIGVVGVHPGGAGVLQQAAEEPKRGPDAIIYAIVLGKLLGYAGIDRRPKGGFKPCFPDVSPGNKATQDDEEPHRLRGARVVEHLARLEELQPRI